MCILMVRVLLTSARHTLQADADMILAQNSDFDLGTHCQRPIIIPYVHAASLMAL